MTYDLALWSYQVKQRYVNSTNTVVSYDITDSVVKIENMTDTGSGEINSATIVLNARKGAFITQENNVNLPPVQPTTPILAEFDKIEIKLTDKNGDIFRKVYEVRTLEIKKTLAEGVRLIVRLIGQERALAEVQFSKPFYYANAWDVIRDIIDQYQDNKGSRQPTVENHDVTVDSGTYYNDLPKWNYNNWDFGQKATACYEGIDEVVNSLGTSISGGGAGDFFETRFYDQFDANFAKLDFQGFSSGSQPELDGGTITTLESSIVTPHYQTTGEIEARTGTVICGKGAMGFGSLPNAVMKWWGEFEAFMNGVPEWDSSYYYKTDNIVAHAEQQEIKWRALRDNNNVEPTALATADWEKVQMGDLITAANYSPWTNDGTGSDNTSTTGYQMWNASSANPNFQSTNDWDELMVFDGNMYSDDKGSSGQNIKQEFVDYYGSSTYTSTDGALGTVPENLLYGSTGAGFYRGFKMLVDSDVFPLAGAFDENGGRDRFGNKYDKAIVRFRGYSNSSSAHDYKNWDVVFPKKNANNTDAVPSTGSLCAVIYNGDNRIFEATYGLATNIWRSYWQTETKQSVAITPYKDQSAPLGIEFFGGQNHCFHEPSSVYQSDGVNNIFVRTGSSTSVAGNMYGTNSAITWKYAYGSLAALPAYRNTDGYYRHGAWACIRFPFPTSEYDEPDATYSGFLGSKYGNNATKKEPVTVDINNMHLTPSGNVGFNNSEAEELGQIDGIEAFMKLDLRTSDDVTEQAYRANFKMRCTCYDSNNNTAVQDFVIPFNAVFYHMKLPIKSFKVYRSRAYWGGQSDIGAELFPPELEILEVFQWKNLKMITFQTQDSYDDQGRYHPDGKEPFGTLKAGTVRLSIDNFHFSKQLLATSGVDTARNLTPQWLLRPFTTNYYQLKKDVLSQKDIDGFQYQGYDVTTEGVCDPNLKFGYSFYLKDDKIVNRTDKPTDVPNTIKLVAKKIVYNIDGTTGGQGGFTRTVTGVKRFESGE